MEPFEPTCPVLSVALVGHGCARKASAYNYVAAKPKAGTEMVWHATVMHLLPERVLCERFDSNVVQYPLMFKHALLHEV